MAKEWWEDAPLADSSSDKGDWWKSAPLEGEAKPRGAIAEIANQGYAGVVSDLPEMAGKALQYSSDKGRPIYELGKRIADAGALRGKSPDLQPDPENHNGLTNILASGARMLPQSIVPAAAVGGALSAAPAAIPGAAILGASALLGSLPAAMSQGQQTLDKAREAGISDEIAIPAARKTAAIEGLGETAGTYFGGKLLGVGGKAISTTLNRAMGRSGTTAAGNVLEDATSRAVLKPFIKQLPETMGVEAGTEMGQNAGEAAVEQQAGIDTQTPWDAAKQAVGPTVGMTLLLAPFGLAGHGLRARNNGRRADLLASAQSDPEQRLAVATDIQKQLQTVDPVAAQNFGQHAQAAIDGGADLQIGENLFSPPVDPAASAVPTAVNHIETTGTTGTILRQDEQAPQATPSAETGIPVTSSPEQTSIDQIIASSGGKPGPLAQTAILSETSGAAALARIEHQSQQDLQDQREWDNKPPAQTTDGENVTVDSKGKPLTNPIMAKKAAREMTTASGQQWESYQLGNRQFGIRQIGANNGTSPNVSPTGTGSAGPGENVAGTSLGDGSGIANQPSVPQAVPADSMLGNVAGNTSGVDAGAVNKIALQNQSDAGWNTDWPFVPADLGNADFRQLIRDDASMSEAEKAQVFDAGYKLGIVPKNESSASAVANTNTPISNESIPSTNSTPAASTQSAPLGVTPSSEPTGPNSATPSGNAAKPITSSGPIRLSPVQSAQLQEAHKALGRDVTQAQVQSMRDRVAGEIESGTTNNGGVIAKLKPLAITQRRAKLARLDHDLSLFQPTEKPNGTQAAQTFTPVAQRQEAPAAAKPPAASAGVAVAPEVAEPNFEAAKALLAEQKKATGNAVHEGSVRAKLRKLAAQTPQNHTKTAMLLDTAATRLGMGEGKFKGLEFAPEVAPPQAEVAKTHAMTQAKAIDSGPAVVMQNRDRSSAASVAQMNEIAARPDYLRAGQSSVMDSGAPVVFGDIPATALVGKAQQIADGKGQRTQIQYAVVEASDLIASHQADGTAIPAYANGEAGKLRAVAGNGRTAGIVEGYNRKTADTYKQDLIADAQNIGVDPTKISGMKSPVLVRVMDSKDVTADIGDRSNISSAARLSAVEQAATDARRLNLESLEFNEDGSPTNASVAQFVNSMPTSEQSELIGPDGAPTKQAIDRLMAATFKQAYGSDELVSLYAQAQDSEARTILSGMADAAGSMASLKDAGEYDIRGAIAEAAGFAVNARRQGQKLTDMLKTRDIMMSDEALVVAQFMADNVRSAKKISDGLRNAADLAAEQAQIARDNKDQGGMFGETPVASRYDIFRRLNGNKQITPQENGIQQPGGIESAQAGAIQPASGQQDGQEVGRVAPDAGNAQKGADLLGDKPNASQQAAANILAAKKEKEKSALANAPAFEGLDMVDSRNGNVVAPGQQEIGAERKPADPVAEAKGEHKVGDLVKLTKPNPAGGKPINIVGHVTKIMPDGKLEIRTQQDGYQVVAPSDLGHAEPAQPAAQEPIKAGDKIKHTDGQIYTVVDVYGNTVDAERTIESEGGVTRKAGISLNAMEAMDARKAAQEPAQPAAKPGENVVKEPEAVYTAKYETDLFGNPLPETGRNAKPGRPDSTGLRRDVHAAKGVSDTPTPAGKYFVNTIVGKSFDRELGARVIFSAQQAAQATQYLYKSAVERLDGIVIDKKGRPLAVVGGFKGAVAEARAYPSTLMAEAIRVPGAAYIWFSHNHPSGKSTLSIADVNLNATLSDAFRGSGIEPRGLLAIAGEKYSYVDEISAGQYEAPKEIKPSLTKKTVPVIERELGDKSSSLVMVSSPAEAIAIGKQFYDVSKEPGILLLDVQNQIAGWIPVSKEMTGKLRHTGGANQIFRALSQSNASAAIIIHGGELDAKVPGEPVTLSQNIAAALTKVDVRALDSVNTVTGRSAAELGYGIAEGPMFAQGNKQVAPAAQTQATQQVEKLVNAIKAKWANAPEIVVAFDMSDDHIPERVRAEDLKQRSGGAVGTPEGFYYKGKVYLMSSQLATPNDVARVLAHEALGHAGLRGVFGADLNNILNQIVTMRRKDIIAKARDYGLVRTDKNGKPIVDVKTATDAEVFAAMDESHKFTAAEEVLARMAQDHPELGFVKRAIAAIRNWLRNNVPGFQSLKLTDNDIIQQFILPARGWVERGQGTAGGDAAFARVWHGSPHRFLTFDSSKIGTGEGAQAYGHGLYLAESPEVATGYAKKLADAAPIKGVSGKEYYSTFSGKTRAMDEAVHLLNVGIYKTPEEAIVEQSKIIFSLPKNDVRVAPLNERLSAFREMAGDKAVKAQQHLYQVDLPDEYIAKMLDWDKPLSGQSKEVQAAIAKTKTMLPPNAMDDLGGDLSLMYGPHVTPEDFLNTWESFGPKNGAETVLQQLGVPGVKYLDGGSRGAGTGTSNYVIFPGMEHILTIIDINGKPLSAAEKESVISDNLVGRGVAGGIPAFNRGTNEAVTNPETWARNLLRANGEVDGRIVRDHTPNLSSIDASIANNEILPGVRSVPLSAFNYQPGKPDQRTLDLAAQIKASGEVNPLIVGVDAKGPYIIEGGHRLDALIHLGAKELPARVVLDMDELGQNESMTNNDVVGNTQGWRSADDNTLGAAKQSFHKWFKGSKVVGEDGKPLVVYHGTNFDLVGDFSTELLGENSKAASARMGFFFASEPKVASSYGPNGAVYPVVLSIKNPYIIDYNENFYRPETYASNIAWAKSSPEQRKELIRSKYKTKPTIGMRSRGVAAYERESQEAENAISKTKDIDSIFDGVIFRNTYDPGNSYQDGKVLTDVYVVFEPSQIRSSIGVQPNEPTAPESGGAFSRSLGATLNAAANNDWSSPEQSRFDDLIYKLQDKQIDTRRVIDSIKKTGKALADDLNTYLQEELFHGRVAKRTEDFVNKELNPLMTQMRMRGIDIPTLDKYLHARHAQEANELIAGRNPDIQDGGSGMLTADAKAYLDGLSGSDRKRLEIVASKVDDIIAKTRQTYADYGLESQAKVDGWGEMFKHYVPLMREDKDGGMGIGQGFSIKGKETKGRTGSTRTVVDILANIAMQRERALVRGEKNRVSTALVGLAEANPNPDFWTVDKIPTEKVYDPKTNSVVDRQDPLYKSRENVLVAKIKTSDGGVVEKAVVFNEDNERAVRMAAALKNLDAAKLEGLLGASAKVTRYFSAISTQYNPIFGVVNLTRDFQEAMINLNATPLKAHKKDVASHVLSALKGIYLDARAVRDGKTATSSWAGLWEEFQNEGGQTGYRDMFRNSGDRAKVIEFELNPTKWMESPLGKIFTAGGALKMPFEIAQKKAVGLFGWLSDYNEAMENSVRLSAYKVAKEQGMSNQQAASLAKNLTVNFNRKGQVGQQAGALYAFFNASMQGTARIGQTLFDMDGSDARTIRLSAIGKKVVAGGVMLGVMQALMLAAAGFDDEDPPDFVRERSLIIPTGDKKYITIPMPLGLSLLPNIGRIPTEMALNGFKNPAKHISRLLGLVAGTFNPIGGGASLVQILSPTAVDPMVAIAENKDWTGKPIAKVTFNKATPGFTLARDTASKPSKMIAEAINYLSGGDQYKAGVLSPTPDQIDYLWGQATGGVGREVNKAEQTVSAVISGEELPTYKIPLVGRFYGNAQEQSSQSNQFYNNINQLNEHEAEIKGLRKDRKTAELAEYLRDNPEARLFMSANHIDREIQKLRHRKSELLAKDAPVEQVRELENQITQRMTRFNEIVTAAKLKKAA